LGAIAASTICLTAYSAATLSIPHYFGALIDAACQGDMPIRTASILIGLFAMSGASNFLRLNLVGSAGEKMINDLRVRLYRSIVFKKAGFFDSSDHMAGSLVQRVVGDTSIVGVTLTEALSNGTKNVFQMLGSLGIMLYLSTPLTGVILVMLPPLVIVAGQYGKFVRKLQSQRQDSTAKMAASATERLSHILTVKAFASERLETSLFERNSKSVLQTSLRMVHWNAAYTACLHMGGYMTLYGLVYGGSMLVATKDITAGTLFSFILYTIYCGLGIVGSVNFATDLNKGFGASMGLFRLLDASEEVNPIGANLSMGEAGKSPMGGSNIEITNLSFSYPSRPDAFVYRGVNLHIRPGVCTAIVGASGSGKSTLAKLLLKLYPEYEGTITIDGVDLRSLNEYVLRARIGYVPQEPVLFNGTIAQNIAYGVGQRQWHDPIDAWTMNAIQEATQLSNAHEFIMSLPDGYDTVVGESGKAMSGGQKQRIAIARALIKNPTLLILDEATSALDRESEKVVQQSTEGIIKNARSHKQRAVLIITHRLSMIQAADNVVVIDQGKVVSEGSQADIGKCPIFRQLVGLDGPSATS
jgi:ATP-binding cassette subfamily B (MDR/TAP) protein 10